MQHLIAAILLGIISTTAHAQDKVQGTDPDFVQKALTTLQLQRNRAMDEAASAEAQLLKSQQEIADLKKEVDALKPKDKK